MKKGLISTVTVVLLAILAGCTEEQFGLAPGRAVDPAAMRPEAIAILKRSIDDTNAYVRIHSIEVAATTQCKEMAPYIRKRMTDSVLAVRFAAILAVGDMECIGYADDVRGLLNDVNVNVQIAAAYSLAKLNEAGHVQQIRDAAFSGDQTVRANALLLLGKLGNPDDVPLVYKVMHQEDSSDKVRMQAVESIARLGDNQIYRTKLWALLISKYADDRVMGIRGMGALGNPEAENAILTMLSDDVLEVRLAAAEELGRLGNVAGERLLLEYFQSNPNLNQVDMANNLAIRALGRIPSPRLKIYLPKVLASDSKIIQLLGAQAVLLLS